MKKKFCIVSAAIITLISLVFLMINSGMALTIKMTTPELTKHSQAIVRGKVTDMRSEWDPERRFIWTLVTISVSRCIKGDTLPGQEVIVKIPGGVVGQIAQLTEDTPIFKKGEDVLLFINPEVYRGKKVFRVTGNFQGKNTIKKNMVIEKKLPIATFLGQIEGEL